MTLLPDYLVLDNGTRYNLATQSFQLWQLKADPNDPGWNYKLRGCSYPDPEVGTNGCPGVAVIYDQQVMKLDKYWQYYFVAVNPGMELRHVSALLNYKRAIANGTGFDKPGSPRANYILNTNIDNGSPLVALDKDRSFILNTHSGIDMGDTILFESFDGTKPPPMKPGKSQPETLSQIKPEDYFYLPETHRHMFVILNNIKALPGGDYTVFPFDNDGGVYSWMGDNDPYCFMPLVSVHPLYYPKNRLWKVNEFRSPYKRVP